MLKLKFVAITILMFAVLVFSCKKKDTEVSKRDIKYEITGNFTGKLLIVYNDNVNGNTLVTDVTLPWSKEITYGNNVSAIGIGGNASVVGVAGQTVTVKIYSGGSVVRSGTATAGALGEITLPALTFTF